MQAQGVLFGQIAAVFGIVIAGVWGATQWTAAALGYQLRLGSPWFDFFGTPVYHPWRLFEWWFFFDAYAPHVFDIGGAIAGGSGLVAVVVFVLVEALPGDAATAFFDDIVKGTLARLPEIDSAIIARLASGWSMERLDRTMKAILRAGAYELMARGDVPVGAVVSEYVDVAKAFFDAREAGFASVASAELLAAPHNPVLLRRKDSAVSWDGERFSGSGNTLRVFQIECRRTAAAQFTYAGAVVIGPQQLAEGLAKGAAGADHQCLVAVAQAGQVHGWAAPRRKNSVTWPSSMPNLLITERLTMVSSSIRYIQSSKWTT